MSRLALAAGIVIATLSAVRPADAQPKGPPATFPPDAPTADRIRTKTAELGKAVADLRRRFPRSPGIPDIEIYLKAAERVVLHGEFYQKESAAHTVAVLDAGLARAGAMKDGNWRAWMRANGKPAVLGYRSWVDGSVQPYAVTIPAKPKPPGKGQGGYLGPRSLRTDIVLHGRDATLTEVKFIQAKESAKPAVGPADTIIIEPFGRGNLAYRWAGEKDVWDAFNDFQNRERLGEDGIDPRRVILRGFSMGGAGTWHIGLHHPDRFNVLGPGAGFTVTRGYVRGLPERLPDYQEKCLRIYDAADYAENMFNVPVVAYSGEKDPQIAAVRNVEARLAGFKEPVKFTHLVAPGLEHKMPPEWQAKAEAEYSRYVGPFEKRDRYPRRVRFTTYTPRYGTCYWVAAHALETLYEKAVIDAVREGDAVRVTTTNVRRLYVQPVEDKPDKTVVIDGQPVPFTSTFTGNVFEKQGGKWAEIPPNQWKTFSDEVVKKYELQGPIDDAFQSAFIVVPPTGDGWSAVTGGHATAAVARFGREWSKYFRGDLPVRTAGLSPMEKGYNLVLFGDPASNPLIAEVVAKLPIRWTKDEIVVNGVKYDPKAHLPALIYPNPLHPQRYVVINSGHTFRETDLKGTNALLYPRLGDWAVLKPAPTADDPAAADVIAAGLFDGFWKFQK